MPELIIDNETVQLGNNKLVFSKAGYSFEDWITKDITYSERITLPETSLLNSIFSRPMQPAIQGEKFSKYRSFKYKDNGKIVFSGISKLLGFNDNKEFEIQLLDGSFELFENMENKLNALDLSSDDFTFNGTSYGTLKVLTSSVWIWSASSMHQDKILSKNVLNANYAFSRPFFSVKRLFEAILDNNNWNYSLETDADVFDKLIVSARNDFVFTSFEKVYNTTWSSGNIDLSSPDFLNGDTLTGSTQLNITYNCKIRLRGNADADNDFVLTITVSGTKPQTQTFILNKGAFDYDLTSNEYTGGDSLVISLSGTGNVDVSDFRIYTIIDENDFGTMSSANFVGYKVITFDNLPDITQKDLFKYCLVELAGFFGVSFFNKDITIHSMKPISKLSAIDWSDKFIEDSENIVPLSNYGKINYFNYNNSDIKPSNLGRGAFTIDDETLADTVDIFDSIFAASPEVTINSEKMIDNDVYDDTGRINEINDLIGYYEVSGAYTVARFEDLNGNTVLSEYYANFITAIQRGEVIKAMFNLNKSDFFLFDFTQLIYLEQKNSTFYVIRIGEYSENEATEVTLLKF